MGNHSEITEVESTEGDIVVREMSFPPDRLGGRSTRVDFHTPENRALTVGELTRILARFPQDHPVILGIPNTDGSTIDLSAVTVLSRYDEVCLHPADGDEGWDSVERNLLDGFRFALRCFGRIKLERALVDSVQTEFEKAADEAGDLQTVELPIHQVETGVDVTGNDATILTPDFN